MNIIFLLIIFAFYLQPFTNIIFNGDKTLFKIPLQKCLPLSISLQREISRSGTSIETVGDVLKRIHAYCSIDSILFDKNGKRIYLYELQDCLPFNQNSDEGLKRQNKEIDQLRASYFVVTIPCRGKR